jgi:uncharacterized membrane protein YtjA (UPF0391 family)
MLRWAVFFLGVAAVAAFASFGGLAAPDTAGAAKTVFFVSIGLFVAALIANALRGGAPHV